MLFEKWNQICMGKFESISVFMGQQDQFRIFN